jgi:hypothetical protein
MKAMIRVLLLLFWWLATGLRLGFAQASSTSNYFPLQKGNKWVYVGNDPARRRVTWEVTSAERLPEGTRYQVWPKPMVVDDEARILIALPGQLLDDVSGIAVLRYPLSPGAEWSIPTKNYRTGKDSTRTIRVIKVKYPCVVGTIKGRDCLLIEDADGTFGIRTLTTYISGIGPAKFEEFEQGNPKATSRMSLESYRVAK